MSGRQNLQIEITCFELTNGSEKENNTDTNLINI